MPASWPLARAQFRQVALTGQPRQMSLAVLTWARADLMSPSGKNSSGSASRQAASSRQSGRRSRTGLAAVVDVLMVLAFVPPPVIGPRELATVRLDSPGGRGARPVPGQGHPGA